MIAVGFMGTSDTSFATRTTSTALYQVQSMGTRGDCHPRRLRDHDRRPVHRARAASASPPTNADPAICQVSTRYHVGFNFSYSESRISAQKRAEDRLAGIIGKRMTLRRSFAASVLQLRRSGGKLCRKAMNCDSESMPLRAIQSRWRGSPSTWLI